MTGRCSTPRRRTRAAASTSLLTEDDSGRSADADGANYPRLKQIKQKYDPANLFRSNQNIAPA